VASGDGFEFVAPDRLAKVVSQYIDWEAFVYRVRQY
jgi:hypothetical protein